MARNIYKSTMAVGLAGGRMRASMYDLASFEGQKKMEDIELAMESEQLNRNIGVVSDTLSLASTAAGRYEDVSEDISVLESKYGEMEQSDGMLNKLLQNVKIGFGVGEYKFGDKTISGKDVATSAAKITQQNMFDEAMSNIEEPLNTKKPLEIEKPPKQEFISDEKFYSQNEEIINSEDEGIEEFLKQRYRM
mgnify:CR=1 FL=1|tara:strand:- start:420 stop:995 length:576 start_codon:yes stop_codon:yes gene_type:complete